MKEDEAASIEEPSVMRSIFQNGGPAKSAGPVLIEEAPSTADRPKDMKTIEENIKKAPINLCLTKSTSMPITFYTYSINRPATPKLFVCY